jgi:hypothetical protein
MSTTEKEVTGEGNLPRVTEKSRKAWLVKQAQKSPLRRIKREQEYLEQHLQDQKDAVKHLPLTEREKNATLEYIEVIKFDLQQVKSNMIQCSGKQRRCSMSNLQLHADGVSEITLQGFLYMNYSHIVMRTRDMAKDILVKKPFAKNSSNTFALENMVIGFLYRESDVDANINLHVLMKVTPDAGEHLRDIALQAAMDVAIELGWEKPSESEKGD